MSNRRNRIRRWIVLTVLLCSSMMMACSNQKQVETEELPYIETVIVDPRENATEAKVYFNRQSGFYDALDLEMYCPVENAEIYYTTDGTIPTQKSLKYEGPISLTDKTSEPEVYAARTDFNSESKYVPAKRIVKGNIFRAVAYLEDGTATEVTNGTFIIGQDRRALYGNTPVISLITDPENMFHEETGILILGKRYEEWLGENPDNINEPDWKVQGNFSNKGKEWERPVAFEYMPIDGNNLSADMGVRVKGGSTRTYIQKSLKFYAREEYGAKSLKAELIPGNVTSGTGEPITKYKNFVLRNGGNDSSFGKLRDPLIQALVVDRHFDTQQSTPCVVFLDGEYWGLYTLNEEYSDNYIETNYGVDKKNVVIVKTGEIDEGEDEDIALYDELFWFITSNDMCDAANYEKAAEMIDIPGFIDYVALCLYVDNRDSMFDNNNWSIWRVREADGETPWSDGKWRFLIYDNEYSSGIYEEGKGYELNNISGCLDRANSSDSYGSSHALAYIFGALYQNEQFKQDLIRTLCDLRNINFSTERFDETFNKMAPEYRRLAGDSFYRYGPDWVVDWNNPYQYYSQKLEEVKKYFYGRYQEFPTIIKSAFDLEKPVKVKINVSDANMGDVQLNQSVLDLSKWMDQTFSGEYFKNSTLVIEAKPKEGFRFVKWDVSGADILEEQGSKIMIQPTKKCSVTVTYAPE